MSALRHAVRSGTIVLYRSLRLAMEIIDGDALSDATRVFRKMPRPSGVPLSSVADCHRNAYQAGAGISVEDACRQIGISQATFMCGR